MRSRPTHHSLPYFLLLPLIFFSSAAVARPLINSSPALVSDGVDAYQPETSPPSSVSSSSVSEMMIRMKTTDVGSEMVCEQMYGFLPCSQSVGGHLFLILVYEFLLFHGESYVASGGERIFKILGPGVFGASAFQLIGSLPEALILLGKPYVVILISYILGVMCSLHNIISCKYCRS